MKDKKYSKFLTILLIIIIVGIIGLVAYLGFDYYRRYSNTQDGSEFVEAFISGSTDDNSTDDTSNTNIENIADNVSTNTSTSTTTKQYYKGFETIGTIEIPKTDVSYPILVKSSKKALETAVVIYYPSDPVMNTVGNIVIAGHNYRNGQFFSNNKLLSEGDEIYITDLERNRVKYIIYNIFETSETDTSFYNRDTDGAREITLTTCTDDSSARLIIEAKAEGD